MYADKEPTNYQSKYAQEYCSRGAVPGLHENPKLTLCTFNDIGSKVQRHVVHAQSPKALTAEMTATHFSMKNTEHTDYVTASQRMMASKDALQRAHAPTRFVPKDNDTMHIIFPHVAGQAVGPGARSVTQGDFQPKRLSTANVGHQHITVCQTNDIGTRLHRTELSSQELFKSQVQMSSRDTHSSSQYQMTSMAHSAYADPKSTAAATASRSPDSSTGRFSRLSEPGESRHSRAALHTRSSMLDAPAGKVTNLSHAGFDIVSGRQRLLPQYMSYEYAMQRAHAQRIAAEAQPKQEPGRRSQGAASHSLSFSPIPANYHHASVYQRSEVPIKSFDRRDPMQTGTDTPAYNIITGADYYN
jgi:hypothetical protein